MTSPITFVKQTKDEIMKVVWPTRTTVIRLTVMVIFVSIFIGVYIGSLDFIFDKAIEIILNK